MWKQLQSVQRSLHHHRRSWAQSAEERENSFMCGMFLVFFLLLFSSSALWLENRCDLKHYGGFRAASRHKTPFFIITVGEEVIMLMSAALPIVVVTLNSSFLSFISFICAKRNTYKGTAQNTQQKKKNKCAHTHTHIYSVNITCCKAK